MPKIVDHDERRAALCLAAARLIHEKGLEAATVRAIAKAAGCSTGVLAHYFTDKNDLVAHVLSFVNRRPMIRIQARMEDEPEPSSILGLLDEVLPLDEERRMEWSVRLAIWGFRPDLQSFRPSGEVSWLEGAASIVELAQDRGIVPAVVDVEGVAGRLTAAMLGASLCAVFEPDRFDAAWLRRYVADAFEDAFGVPIA